MAESKAPAEGAPKKLGTLTAAELSNLERRMQIEDPATIEMPGGGTFKDFLDAQAQKRVDDDAAQKSRDAETARIIEQSPALPDRTVMATAEGNIISTPVPGTEPEAKPPAGTATPAPASAILNAPAPKTTT